MNRIDWGYFAFVRMSNDVAYQEMKLTELVNPSVLTQPVYEPGRPIDDVARELGFDPKEVIKVASNENPLGSSPKALAAMRAVLGNVALYPDGGCVALREVLAGRHGVTSDQIVIGNGSNELIEMLGHLFLSPKDEVVMGAPAFIVYKLVTLLFGAKPVEVPLKDHVHDLAAMAAAITPATKLIFLPTPNNPTGTTNGVADLRAWALSLPKHVVLVVDEAYGEYLDEMVGWDALIEAGARIVVLRTFSKIFGLAGLRVGYGRTSIEMAGLLQRVRQPFNVNSLAQAGAIAAVGDETWIQKCRDSNSAGLAHLSNGLDALGLEYVPSVGNFLLVKVGQGQDCFRFLQERGVIVRPVGPYGLPEWIRVTVGTLAQNERLLSLLEQRKLDK
jgi:histidinol-phosphate aminotransferase